MKREKKQKKSDNNATQQTERKIMPIVSMGCQQKRNTASKSPFERETGTGIRPAVTKIK